MSTSATDFYVETATVSEWSIKVCKCCAKQSIPCWIIVCFWRWWWCRPTVCMTRWWWLAFQSPFSFRRRNTAGQQIEQRIIWQTAAGISGCCQCHYVFHLATITIQFPVCRRSRIGMHQMDRHDVQRQIWDARQICRHCVQLLNIYKLYIVRLFSRTNNFSI